MPCQRIHQCTLMFSSGPATGPYACAGGRQLQDAQATAPSAADMQMQQGMAPGPAPAEPMANILFTVSAPRAVLTGSALTLMDVSPIVQFYTTESKAGVYLTGAALGLLAVQYSTPQERATVPGECLIPGLVLTCGMQQM